MIRGSALKALESSGDLSRSDENAACIWELMDAVDSYIPTPERAIDRPFLMPVEDVFGIKGRGTVATGRIERGVVKTGESVEIVGMKDETRTVVVTGVEMFQKTLDQGMAGDNVGCLLRGVERADIERGQVLAKPGLDQAAQDVPGAGVRVIERRGRAAHAVLQRVPAAVLHPHDRRDGSDQAAGGSGDGDAGG